jgi:hypothetical protein
MASRGSGRGKRHRHALSVHRAIIPDSARTAWAYAGVVSHHVQLLSFNPPKPRTGSVIARCEEACPVAVLYAARRRTTFCLGSRAAMWRVFCRQMAVATHVHFASAVKHARPNAGDRETERERG